MRYRTLGRTGLEVSELAYGTWGIGKAMWGGADDVDSLRSLRRAFELGVTFVDTALSYGEGHSEQLVARAVHGAPGPIHVGTKVPPMNGEWPARPGVAVADVFPSHWITESTERSLRNLGVDALDLQQLHVWSDEWIGEGDWLDAIDRLKRDGKIRFFGVSINSHEPENALRLIATGLVDTVQVVYNVFDQSPADELFAAAQTANVGVIVRVPFDEGALTGRVTPDVVFPEGDFRSEYFEGDRKREVWDRVQAIAREIEVPVDRIAESALRFCISHPAVSTVNAGMRSLRNVEANARAVDAGPLDEPALAALRAHRWAKNYYKRGKAVTEH